MMICAAIQRPNETAVKYSPQRGLKAATPVDSGKHEISSR